jgi:regulator of nonsense transcripts 2
VRPIIPSFRSRLSCRNVYAADGRPTPGQTSPVDAPDDFFRIRLVCVLLDAVGMCFDRGSLKRKLDDYLVFFQVI